MTEKRTKAVSKSRSLSRLRRNAGGEDSLPLSSSQSEDAAAKGVANRLDRLGCDPFAIMAEIACDPDADRRLRLAAAKELAAYLMLKPRKLPVSLPAATDVGGIIADGWTDGDSANGRKDGNTFHMTSDQAGAVAG
ncbi:MAG: hypothetical protein AB7P12_03880 [Alphaproteobacteria bacterium]